MRLNREQREQIIRLYPTMTPSEIERATGIDHRKVGHVARRYKLQHTPETLARISRRSAEHLATVRHKVNHKVSGRKLHRLIERDYERMWEGKPQLTRRRLRKTTIRAQKAKLYLRYKYGYEYDPTEPYTMLIVPTTQRRAKEGYYIKRYGITFKTITL